MQFTITIVDIGPIVNTPKAGSNGYNSIEVAFRKDGKIEGKKLIDFAAPEAYKAIQQFKAGDNITVTAEKKPGKDGKEYWYWTALSAASADSEQTKSPSVGSSTGSGSTGRVIGSNYETPAERAQKQIYIVRQSSISAALGLAGLNKEKATVESVIATAKVFEDFVFKGDAVQAISDMVDDIPV